MITPRGAGSWWSGTLCFALYISVLFKCSKKCFGFLFVCFSSAASTLVSFAAVTNNPTSQRLIITNIYFLCYVRAEDRLHFGTVYFLTLGLRPKNRPIWTYCSHSGGQNYQRSSQTMQFHLKFLLGNDMSHACSHAKGQRSHMAKPHKGRFSSDGMYNHFIGKKTSNCKTMIFFTILLWN